LFPPNEEKSVKKSVLVFTLLAAVLMIAAAGCGEKKESAQSAPATQAQAAAPANPNMWQGKIVETMDSGGYTYVQLDTGSEKIWAAGPTTEVALGQTVAVDKGMPMPNFTAKSLDRTFEMIYFVGAIKKIGGAETVDHGNADHPTDHPTSGGGMGMDSGSSHNVVEKTDIKKVAKASGGYTVEDIFVQSASLKGQNVKVRGQVVKFTPNIMGTNWVHIQDGTGSGDTADLTVTTSAVVAAGDIVLVEGPLTVNKDFGAGYKYGAIIEGATVTKE
jgi:hypothetical protein